MNETLRPFSNREFEIWHMQGTRWAITVTRKDMFFKLNAVLHRYPKRTRFRAGDEPFFPFDISQIELVASTTPRIARVLNQISGVATLYPMKSKNIVLGVV